MNNNQRRFASDNNASVHPKVMQMLNEINEGHVIGYGDDPYTLKAKKLITDLCEKEVDIFFLTNGTAANTLTIAAMLKPYEAVICSQMAHINVHECGAPEHFAGAKLLTVNSVDGKLTPSLIKPLLHAKGNPHETQPRVICISQTNEIGQVYTLAELKNLVAFAKKNNCYTYIDGARLSNAIASLNCTFAEIIEGIDAVNFGGTKNGLMLAEALIVQNKNLAQDLFYSQKQAMQLSSKMRYVSSQFIPYIQENLWIENARHSNQIAQYLASQLNLISAVNITQEVQSNMVYCQLPHAIIKSLQEEYFFYLWDEDQDIARFVCSFDNTRQDVDDFISAIKAKI